MKELEFHEKMLFYNWCNHANLLFVESGGGMNGYRYAKAEEYCREASKLIDIPFEDLKHDVMRFHHESADSTLRPHADYLRSKGYPMPTEDEANAFWANHKTEGYRLYDERNTAVWQGIKDYLRGRPSKERSDKQP